MNFLKNLTQRRRGAEGLIWSSAFRYGLWAFIIISLSFNSYSQSKLPHFSIENPGAAIDQAFVVQKDLVRKEIDVIGGFKGGAVSTNAKKWFESDIPLSSVLPKHGWLKAEKHVSLTHVPNRVLELEIGFIVGSDITHQLANVEEVKSKISTIVPVVEMPLNRIDKKGKVTFIDHIAANVGADKYLVGKPFPEGVEVDNINMILVKDQKELTSAVGSVADGGQWENVRFQINHALAQGYKVERGQIILTGSLGKVIKSEPGTYKALYEGFSEIVFTFSEGVSFTNKEIFRGGRVNSVQAHDFNNDGLKDVIFSAEKKLYLGLAPDYKLRAVYSYPEQFRGASLHSQIMDVDGDGDMDFVGCSSGVYWIECPDNPLSQWQYHQISTEFNGVHCVLLHDVDKDGKKDIVVNNYFPPMFFKKKVPWNKFGNSIIWFKIPDNPQKQDDWKPLLIADGTAQGGVHYMSMGDIDGDGVEELFAGAKGEGFKNGDWFAMWQRGSDVTKPWTRVDISGKFKGATHIYPADINLDGKMDLVGSLGHDKGIVWLEGPAFKVREIDDELIAPHAMQVADIDNDGDFDVIACANKSAKAQWFQNDGKGNFIRHHLLDNQTSYDITVSDLNGDGLKDLIIAGWKGGNVIILHQQKVKL